MEQIKLEILTKTLETEEYFKLISSDFNGYVAKISTEYRQKLNDILIKQTESDCEKRYKAIETLYPGCNATKAKEALSQWNQSVAEFVEDQVR